METLETKTLDTEELSPIAQRISQVIDYSKLNPKRFADRLGTSPSRIHHVMTGRNNPSLDLLELILKSFNEVSRQWMLSGEGPMLRSVVNNNQNAQENSGTFSGSTVNQARHMGNPLSAQVQEKELEACRRENELLRQQLASQERLISSLNKIIDMQQK